MAQGKINWVKYPTGAKKKSAFQRNDKLWSRKATKYVSQKDIIMAATKQVATTKAINQQMKH